MYDKGCPTPYSAHAQMKQTKGCAKPSATKSQMKQAPCVKQFTRFTDCGPAPFVINIEKAAEMNNTFRTVIWTGNHLQVTLMSLNVGEDIGIEMHPTVDQFIRIEEGEALIRIGNCKERLEFEKRVCDGYAIMIPAHKWHNVINIGKVPLKLYSIYAPPQHPRCTVHQTKQIAQAAEDH